MFSVSISFKFNATFPISTWKLNFLFFLMNTYSQRRLTFFFGSIGSVQKAQRSAMRVPPMPALELRCVMISHAFAYPVPTGKVRRASFRVIDKCKVYYGPNWTERRRSCTRATVFLCIGRKRGPGVQRFKDCVQQQASVNQCSSIPCALHIATADKLGNASMQKAGTWPANYSRLEDSLLTSVC